MSRTLRIYTLYALTSILLIVLFFLITEIRSLKILALGMLALAWGIRPVTTEPLPMVLTVFATLGVLYGMFAVAIPPTILLALLGVVAFAVTSAALLEMNMYSSARAAAATLLVVEGAQIVSLWTLDPISRSILVAVPLALFLRIHPFEPEVERHPAHFALDLVMAFAVLTAISFLGNWSVI